MVVGLLSETHGSVARTTLALRRLLAHPCELLIHCGDIGAEGVLVEIATRIAPAGIPVVAVLGNVDRYGPDLLQFPESTGIAVHEHLAEVDLDGPAGAVIHGDEPRLLHETIRGGRYDYVFTGHTHVADDRRLGSTRVINPGAVYRSAEPSVAVLDTATEQLTLIRLDRS